MTRSFRAGLVLLGILSVLDLAGPLTTDGDHPPMWVALVGAALGLVSLVFVGLVWRGSRRAVLPLVVLRLVSALTAVPGVLRRRRGIRGPGRRLRRATLAGVALVSGARSRVAVTACPRATSSCITPADLRHASRVLAAVLLPIGPRASRSCATSCRTRPPTGPRTPFAPSLLTRPRRTPWCGSASPPS